jgi:hypothetical protein
MPDNAPRRSTPSARLRGAHCLNEPVLTFPHCSHCPIAALPHYLATHVYDVADVIGPLTYLAYVG